MSSNASLRTPHYIQIDAQDNVAIVANEGGLPSGTTLTAGLTLLEAIPEAHKVALRDIAPGQPIVRYGVVIGYAESPIAKGSWVHEGVMSLPVAPALDGLPPRHRSAGSAAAAPGIYLRRLSQPGRLCRNEEHSGNRNHGAMCLRHGGVRGQAYPIGDPAPLPQRRRCDCDYSSLRMRDCDRCSRLGNSHSHAAQFEFESQPWRSPYGGKPGLRKTAAFANVAGKHASPSSPACPTSSAYRMSSIAALET